MKNSMIEQLYYSITSHSTDNFKNPIVDADKTYAEFDEFLIELLGESDVHVAISNRLIGVVTEHELQGFLIGFKAANDLHTELQTVFPHWEK